MRVVEIVTECEHGWVESHERAADAVLRLVAETIGGNR